MTASVQLPDAPTDSLRAKSDPDDSWFTGGAQSDAGTSEARFVLADGATVFWDRGKNPIVERQDHPLRFRVMAADGSPVSEPYIGMIAHAMVTRDDGSVVHLHPSARRWRADGVGDAHAGRQRSGSLGRRYHGGSRGARIGDGGRGSKESDSYGSPTGRYRIGSS